MDIRRIRYFLELSRVLNFSEASRRLGISQPALTKAVARLESESGSKLIRREGKHTHLTTTGLAMLQRFEDVDAAVSRAENLARTHTRQTLCQLRIGVSADVGPMRAASFLAAFVNRYRVTDIDITDVIPGEVDEVLLSGEVDCAFFVRPDPVTAETVNRRLHVLDLYREPLVIISPLNAATGSENLSAPCCHSPPLPQLGKIDVLTCDACAAKLVRSARKSLRIRCSRDDWTQALVNAGVGKGVVARDSVLKEGACSCTAEATDFQRTVSLAIPTGRVDTKVIQRFLGMAESFDW